MVTAGNPDWSNYTLSTKATKLAGSEGFLVSFGVKDTGNYFWWNLGGWNNTEVRRREGRQRRQDHCH